MNIKYFLILVCSLFLLSCEEEITLEMPGNKAKIVVEGYIQPHKPIIVQITSSKGYFDEITENELTDVFLSDVTNIKVIRNSNNETVELGFIPLDPSGDIGFYSDVNIEDLTYFNSEFAQFGESYTLEIIYNGDTITANTKIPFIESEQDPIVDSIWFVEDEMFPGYGDFYMSYNDNDTMGNNIMLESKRIFHYDIEEEENTPDFKFVKALWGAVRNDFEGFNGVKHFETYFERGEDAFFGESEGEIEGEFGNFTSEHLDSLGNVVPADTVLIRLSQIDSASFKFWRSIEFQEQMNGNPFAEPMNLQSNITNGLGIWEGKGSIYFKVIAQGDTAFIERYNPDIFEALF
jgi:hypothetical protein